MPDLLVVRGLTVRYGAARAVEGVDLDIAASGVAALLGANGAGKSSILRAIAGLTPSSGALTFAGENLGAMAARQRVARGIVYVPEGRQIVSALTVGENLLLGGYRAEAGARAKRREQLLELFPEIAGRLRSPAWMLSGGEQQMLAIARGLMSNPRLLLLDEPSLGLAPLLIRRVFERLAEIKREAGLAILLVEQNFRMAMKLADTFYFVRNGAIVGRGDAQDFADEARRGDIVDAYLGAAERPVSGLAP